MKKFLNFIWELVGPLLEFVLGMTIIILTFAWISTGFGLILMFNSDDFTSPIWLKYVIGFLDVFCLAYVIYEMTIKAYNRVYK
jgi:hypothetical protein